MVVQRTIDNLKDRPKDERKVVAGGIAIFVVVILLSAWAFFFFKRIQSGAQEVNLSSGAQENFNFTSTKEAQQALEQQYSDNTNDLLQLRTDAAANQVGNQQQVQVQDSSNTNQFGGSSNSSY